LGFKKLEKDILYLPAQFDGNDFKAFNAPFFIDSLEKIKNVPEGALFYYIIFTEDVKKDHLH